MAPGKNKPKLPAKGKGKMGPGIFIPQIGRFVTDIELFGGKEYLPIIVPCYYDSIMPAMREMQIPKFLETIQEEDIVDMRKGFVDMMRNKFMASQKPRKKIQKKEKPKKTEKVVSSRHDIPQSGKKKLISKKGKKRTNQSSRDILNAFGV